MFDLMVRWLNGMAQEMVSNAEMQPWRPGLMEIPQSRLSSLAREKKSRPRIWSENAFNDTSITESEMVSALEG